VGTMPCALSLLEGAYHSCLAPGLEALAIGCRQDGSINKQTPLASQAVRKAAGAGAALIGHATTSALVEKPDYTHDDERLT
jgi:hypothetical protein